VNIAIGKKVVCGVASVIDWRAGAHRDPRGYRQVLYPGL